MTARKPPGVEPRRKPEFAAELLQRARDWMPAWELDPAARDFGMALLDIAARFTSEVAERLDRVGEKTTRGLLDWLGMAGQAARGARMPVVLRLTENRPDPVLARAPVTLRADTAAGPVVFETSTDATLVPGRLAALVAVNAADDAFFLPAPGLDQVEPPPPQPDTWRTRTFAEKGATRLQLDPELGLAPDMLFQVGTFQYRVTAVDKDLVTFEPALDEAVEFASLVTRVSSFAPFDGTVARNRQSHALYIGDADLLDIQAAATIEVAGLAGVPAAAEWQYWGKADGADDAAWRTLTPSPDDPLKLAKPAGSLEPREVAGVESRWIRAIAPRHTGVPITFDCLQLRINPGTLPDSCPFEPDSGASPAIEGVANATPQVLDGVFYPFGREPRLLDTFYLGCAEAFSKPQAKVALCFDLADPSMKSLTLVPRARGASPVLAAAAQDGSLHLLKFERSASGTGERSLVPFREPVQPPTPKDGGEIGIQSPIQLDRALDEHFQARPAAWGTEHDFLVAVAAGSRVWAWHENTAVPAASGWRDIGEPGPELSDKERIVDLVHVGGIAALFALRGGRLFRRPSDSEGGWSAVQLDALAVPSSDLAALAPVMPVPPVEDTGLPADLATPALCAIDNDGTAWLILLNADGTVLALAQVPGLAGLSRIMRPLALLDELPTGELRLMIVAAAADLQSLHAYRSEPFKARGSVDLKQAPSPSPLPCKAKLIGRDLDVARIRGEIAVGAASAEMLIVVTPFSATAAKTVRRLPIPVESGRAGGAPVFLGPVDVIVPGTRSDALAGTLELGEKIEVPLTSVNLRDVLETDALDTDANRQVAAGDTFAYDTGSEVTLARIGARRAAASAKAYHYLDLPVGKLPDAPRAGVYRVDIERPHHGDRLDDRRQLEIAEADLAPSLLIVRGPPSKRVYTIARILSSSAAGAPGKCIVTLDRDVPGKDGPVRFWPQLGEGALRALLDFAGEESKGWTDALLAEYGIHFPGLQPSPQKAVPLPGLGRGRVLLLENNWVTRPGTGSVPAYIQLALKVTWRRQLGDTANNPELSWEYWNGRGWWKLPLDYDGTANFQRGGMLRLTVPRDLQATEWAGKTNFWIRARLVGGDYGREILAASSTTTPVAGTAATDGLGTRQTQVIERDTTHIHAPAVLRLNLRYSVPAAPPAHLLTEDSATVRDQSAANRTRGAIVEAFVPLGVMLDRLDAEGAQPGAAAECGCDRADAATGAGAAGHRALYLGFDARLQGEQINLLFLPAGERDFDGLAPARVDVLRGARFEPVVAHDGTRGLGEAGIVTLALASPPEPATLFGRTLAWLRIRPRPGDGAWTPALRGVYLNAVWAEAAETQEFEMLGSSDGAPLQQVLLARPPVLQDTLELRVREPLGEEERSALLQTGADRVRSTVEGQPGDWVLWRQVPDPADESSSARVYALDEARGVIRFGDGVHGAIPPIGRDAIMAFRYRHTDAVGADAIRAGSSLGIVTPVEGAEAAFAADLAAGGSPPEDIARVLRFAPARLRQRGAAVTARDLEDMALSLLPAAAQAHCLRRGGKALLVLVMRGADPLPSRAVKREMRRRLLAASPPALAAKGRFDVIGPVPVPFHVRLELATGTLDHGAALADAARKALTRLFDSADGGPDGSGWPLGARPDEVDIATCLLELAHLDAVVDVKFSELATNQRRTPLRAALRDDELAVLAADGIEVQFSVPQEAL